MLYSPKKRIIAVLTVLCLLFTGVFCKLFYVQIVQGKELQARALDQWTRDVPLTAERGKIYDRGGVLLAGSVTRYNVYVRPNAVKDAEKVAAYLAGVLNVNGDELLKKIKKRGVSEITVAKKIEKSAANKVREGNLDGVYLSADIKRYYPYGDFMTQLLGYTNVDSKGQSGLEAYYDKYLTGIDGSVLTETDLIGRELEGTSKSYLPPVSGLNLTLTVDFYIQSIVENTVSAAAAATGAKRVSCLVMNPTNGEILAMSEYPDYDLNNLPRDDLSLLFSGGKNNMVSSVFEPGSTFKILTTAIALQENVWQDGKTFYCAGNRVVDGQKIKCWKTKGHGSRTFKEGVCNSCNCVFMDSALAIGADKFYEYLYGFGLNKKTGLDAVGETSGIFLPLDTVKPVDLARIGFGQAVAVTPIGLATAVASAGNGGYAIEPHLLREVSDDGGNVAYKRAVKVSDGKISAETSAKLRDILQAVVEEGSGKGAYVEGYKIGGKTGTAQKYAGGAIAGGKYMSSFVGFSMTEGAEAMVVFIVDEPVGTYYGSIVAAPRVGEIFKGIFDYYGIAPEYTAKDGEVVGEPFVLPDLRGLSLSAAKHELYKLGIYCEVDGEGDTVTGQLPHGGATVTKQNVVLLYS